MKIYIKSSTTKSPSSIAHSIQEWVKKLSKDPVGNQNCMLCTWAAEQQFRGLDVMPRAVYSPRDPIFSINPKKIVKNSISIPNLTVDKLQAALQRSGEGSRYYVHVNWAGSSGGHEFLAINDNGNLCVIDNKELNEDYLKLNEDENLVDWDEEADIKFMEENGMT